jgi:hypothetical protein
MAKPKPKQKLDSKFDALMRRVMLVKPDKKKKKAK